MAKDYAAIHASENDASALEQRWYIKEETTRGTLEVPVGTDFLFTQSGGSISFNQPFESSPHRSGRHHNNIIKQKKEMNWTLTNFINIDETSGVGTGELDAGIRVLWKSLLGRETVPSEVKFDSLTAPSITFSLYETGDLWSRQGRGCFCNNGALNLPGDAQANFEVSGQGKDAFLIGIGKSTADNNTGNTITLETDEGDRFEEGGLVMLIEADGTTRSADTPDGSPRTITDVTGDVVTVNGAVLADADFSGADGFLTYYEPAAPAGIDNPIVGLRGSVTVVGLTSQCVRSLNMTIENNHEVVDYCFGEDSLAQPFFVPGDRLSVSVNLELNLNHDIVEYFHGVAAFETQDITAVLGEVTGRHLEVLLPKVQFPVPEFTVPDSGSIPVPFNDGMALQTALDAADEITVSYK